jgi:hypothetical protein
MNFFSKRNINFREEDWVIDLLDHAKQELTERLQHQNKHQMENHLVMLSPDSVSVLVIEVLNYLECRDFRRPFFREKDSNKQRRFFF